jgi:GT2 family glycosyltransferase
MKVCAVVVTRNRRALLVECLAALAAQTRAPDRVLVVDNASTDGTDELLRDEYPHVEVVQLPVNQGGAGGFHEGLRRSHEDGFDATWLMDDDTIPTTDCLQALLAAIDVAPDGPPALLSSKVVWSDGRLHPMNHPGFERTETAEVINAAEHRLIPLRTATFVSLLVSRRAVDTYGLPLRRFFLWSDDIEYTARILRHESGYLVPASVALHKTERPYSAVNTSGDRFYFHVRNSLYMLRGPAWTPAEKLSVTFILITTTLAYLRYNHFAPRTITTVLRGLRDGLRRGAPTPAHP